MIRVKKQKKETETKNGIKKEIEKRQKRIRKLQKEIKSLKHIKKAAEIYF